VKPRRIRTPSIKHPASSPLPTSSMRSERAVKTNLTTHSFQSLEDRRTGEEKQVSDAPFRVRHSRFRAFSRSTPKSSSSSKKFRFPAQLFYMRLF
jgi:hypothetical protein